MVVKFFGNSKGGSGASVDYLLNEREEAKTARTLQGDPKLTKELIRSIERKQKVCVGCLSFEEKNIPEAKKYELMAEFEQTLLPDMQGRYNILWVEHTDKGRLELNFVIPRVELETGKGLSPYYHEADAKGMRLFQEVHNLENGWSDPQDPSKARTLEGATKKLELQRDYEQLDTLLHNLVKDGKIQNRAQLIETLEASKINVTRQGKDSISVKLPESLKARKLKGGIYAEQFRSLRSIETISEQARARVTEYDKRDTHTELTRAKQELTKYIQYKHEELRERHPKPIREVRAELHKNKELDYHSLDRNREHEHSHTLDVVSQTERGRGENRDTDTNAIQRSREHQPSPREQELTSTERDIPKQNQTATSREQEPQRVEHTGEQSRLYERQPQVDENNRSTTDRGNEQILGVNREEIKGENRNGYRIRTDVARRTRERERAQQFSLTATKAEPNGIYKRVAENFTIIRERNKEDYTKLRDDTKRGTSTEQSVIREVFAERSGGISSIKERFNEVINHAKEYITTKAKEAFKMLQEMREREVKLKSLEEQKPKEQERTRSRSHGMSMSR